MTIGGWGIFAVIVLVCAFFGWMAHSEASNEKSKIAAVLIPTIVSIATLFGMLWYFSSTASGQRALIDQKSNLSNGIDRTITVYTADGNVIAQYDGKIDIEVNDGGYIKFDFDGKRYIYYNCFVESIAEIG